MLFVFISLPALISWEDTHAPKCYIEMSLLDPRNSSLMGASSRTEARNTHDYHTGLLLVDANQERELDLSTQVKFEIIHEGSKKKLGHAVNNNDK